MLAIFWEDGPDAISYFKELTIQVRVEDAWYSAFLKECRNGQLSEEMYNFLMGFPTLHAGSWMSNGSNEGQVTCGHADCQICIRLSQRATVQAVPLEPCRAACASIFGPSQVPLAASRVFNRGACRWEGPCARSLCFC